MAVHIKALGYYKYKPNTPGVLGLRGARLLNCEHEAERFRVRLRRYCPLNLKPKDVMSAWTECLFDALHKF